MITLFAKLSKTSSKEETQNDTSIITNQQEYRLVDDMTFQKKLKNRGIESLSPIQAADFKPICNRKDVLAEINKITDN
ncbi:4568_t:CDS:2 [Entrophospora sp. SA101]|nr:4568_t:CDS:2 [Entrophospora sp. SA101]